MKAIIVEDEKRSINLLLTLINKHFPEVTVMGYAESVDSAWSLLQKEAVDIVFLDIQLKGEDGFQLLERFGKQIPFSVIFTTAHKQYAIKAIKSNALDYLQKPIDLNELKQALEKASQKKEQPESLAGRIDSLVRSIQSVNSGSQQIILNTFNGHYFLQLNTIVYCTADGSYTTLVLKDSRKIIVSRPLKAFEMSLPENMFCRIHHSTIINLHEVKLYKKKGGIIIMSNNVELDVSRGRQDVLNNKIEKLIF